MAHMLIVPTSQLGHPVSLIISMKPDNRLLHAKPNSSTLNSLSKLYHPCLLTQRISRNNLSNRFRHSSNLNSSVAQLR